MCVFVELSSSIGFTGAGDLILPAELSGGIHPIHPSTHSSHSRVNLTLNVMCASLLAFDDDDVFFPKARRRSSPLMEDQQAFKRTKRCGSPGLRGRGCPEIYMGCWPL